MNLKENKEEDIGGFEIRKGKEKMMWLYQGNSWNNNSSFLEKESVTYTPTYSTSESPAF